MPFIQELFIDAATRFPERCAVVCDTGLSVTSVSYAELLRETNELMDKLKLLHAECEYVGILLESLLTYPAIVISVLRSKCAYAVIDLQNNSVHNSNIFDKLNIRVVITDNINGMLGFSDEWERSWIINIHKERVYLMTKKRPVNCLYKADKFDIAYAIQTSGTTGIPKIVKVPHHCIVPNIIQLRNIFEVVPNDTVFLSSPLTFDPSVVETFLPLISGASLLIADKGLRAAPGPVLYQFLFNKHRECCGNVSILSATPSYIALLLNSVLKSTNQINPELKILSLGGEPCPSYGTLLKWRNKLGRKTKVFSLYGITEVSCWASVSEVIFDKQNISEALNKSNNTDGSLGEILIGTRSEELESVESESVEHCSCGNPQNGQHFSSEEKCMNCSAAFNHCNELVVLKNEIVESDSNDIVCDVFDIPLGLPLDETYLEVRDIDGHTITDGEGELYVGSDTRICLLEDENLEMREKSNVIFRATGDIVQSREDHKLGQRSHSMYYLGRRDGAIKRLGRWIFVESLEKVATGFVWGDENSLISVVSSCCVWCSLQNGRGKLGLFVVPSNKEMLLESDPQPKKQKFVADLMTHLIRILPSNSWPDIILPNEVLPLTKHAKVDRQKLVGVMKSLLCEKVSKDAATESGNYEGTLLSFKSLWMQYLKLSTEPSPFDKFLLSGGDSLSALRIVSELEDVMSCAMPPMLLIHLLNGTYEEACNSIKSISSGGIMHEANLASTSNILGKRTQSDEFDSLKKISTESYSKVMKIGEKLVDENSNGPLCLEYRRGVVFTHRSSSKPEPALLNMEESPILSQEWKYDLLKCVDASPVLLQYDSSKCIVVVGSHSHNFVAVDLETGKKMFCCQLPDRIESSACSSPCGRYIFVGCYDHAMYCITVPEGQICWSFMTAGMVKSSPVVVNGGTAIAFGSYDGFLYCLKIKDGDLLWKVKLHTGSIYSSPTLSLKSSQPNNSENDGNRKAEEFQDSKCSTTGAGVILSSTLSGKCVAVLETDGRILWMHDLKAPIFTSASAFDGFAVFASVKGKVVCFSIQSGEEVWSLQVGGNVFSSFTLLEDGAGSEDKQRLLILGCHDHFMYCLSDSGELKWRTQIDSPVFVIPFIFPVRFCGHLKNEKETSRGVPVSSSNWVATASTTGHLYLLDVHTGSIKAEIDVGGEIFSSPVAIQNRIVFGCRDNFLYCFRIT